MSEASKLSCIVAHKLSGLEWSQLEVTDETDGAITGDIKDAIRRGLWGVEIKEIKSGRSGVIAFESLIDIK